jgi:SAM-dependent methyltransferase
MRSFVTSLKMFKSGPLNIADVGSLNVNGTYRDLLNHEGWTYTGFDMRPGGNVDVQHEFGTGLPEQFREAFDVAVSGQCMEHVAAPWRWIVDVAALLKPGGLLWLSVPCVEVFHEHPIDCWRVYPDGMRAIFREAGLTEIMCYVSANDTVGVARK